jgi:hypothetical protein
VLGHGHKRPGGARGADGKAVPDGEGWDPEEPGRHGGGVSRLDRRQGCSNAAAGVPSKAGMINLGSDRRTDGQTDRQTDRQTVYSNALAGAADVPLGQARANVGMDLGVQRFKKSGWIARAWLWKGLCIAKWRWSVHPAEPRGRAHWNFGQNGHDAAMFSMALPMAAPGG